MASSASLSFIEIHPNDTSDHVNLSVANINDTSSPINISSEESTPKPINNTSYRPQENPTNISWQLRPSSNTIFEKLAYFFPTNDERRDRQGSSTKITCQGEVEQDGAGGAVPSTQSSGGVDGQKQTDEVRADKGAEDGLFSPWTRGQLLGKGSFGRVYLALQIGDQHVFVVKQVDKRMHTDNSDKEAPRKIRRISALKKENRMLRGLKHPNVVEYLGFEETDSYLNLFLQYVSGGTVGDCIRKFGRFDEPTTKSFAGQILEGLKYVHLNNVLHRDLKADNILVTEEGICKISDFGISKYTDNSDEMHIGTAMQGTVFWMAPEIIQGTEGYNAKVDIWSFGCVLLEMWTGERPWGREQAKSLILKMKKEKVAPPIPPNVYLSHSADDLRRRCLEVIPDERASARELTDHPYLQLPMEWKFTGFEVQNQDVPNTSMPFSSSAGTNVDKLDTNASVVRWIRGELIGKGQMHRVYAALNMSDGEIISLRRAELPSILEFQTRKVEVERMKKECHVLKKFNHPNLMQCLGFVEEKEYFCSFMPYFSGSSLGRCLKKYGPFDEQVTIHFLSQILGALSFLHDKGILYRDLRADDVLVDPLGTCKLSAFRIPTTNEDTNEQHMRFALERGSAHWQAPEVVHSPNNRYTVDADVWSLGCVAVEMWTARPPWGKAAVMQVMANLHTAQQIPPLPRGVLLSPKAEDFRRQCFALNPSERPSARDLLTHPYLFLPADWTLVNFRTTPPFPERQEDWVCRPPVSMICDHQATYFPGYDFDALMADIELSESEARGLPASAEEGQNRMVEGLMGRCKRHGVDRDRAPTSLWGKRLEEIRPKLAM